MRCAPLATSLEMQSWVHPYTRTHAACCHPAENCIRSGWAYVWCDLLTVCATSAQVDCDVPIVAEGETAKVHVAMWLERVEVEELRGDGPPHTHNTLNVRHGDLYIAWRPYTRAPWSVLALGCAEMLLPPTLDWAGCRLQRACCACGEE